MKWGEKTKEWLGRMERFAGQPLLFVKNDSQIVRQEI